MSVPLIEIDNIELSRLKHKQIMRCDVARSYSEIWQTSEGLVLKIFHGIEEGDYEFIRRDIDTLYSIKKIKSKLCDRYILPINILKQNNSIIGYTMKYVKGNRLDSFLYSADSDTVSKSFSTIYKDIVSLHHDIKGFSMCDLHEDNIIVSDENVLHYIDLDGWYNGDGKGRNSRYLSMSFERLKHIPKKYKIDAKRLVLADFNSDIFCLIIIIINYIMNYKISFAELQIDVATNYLSFLFRSGISSDFVRMVETLYSTKENYYDDFVINHIPTDLQQCSFSEFLHQTSRFMDNQTALEYLIQNEARLNNIYRKSCNRL